MYTPSILCRVVNGFRLYAEWYIVFAFSSIYLFVCLFIRTFIRHISGIYHSFTLKFLRCVLLGSHSYLGHGYLGVSASRP